MKPKWEYKKIGDICLVERGGSPRPIGQYITDSDDGINWIKIGDTTESMYITKTAQKIKPEGMKKSRYVQSGDFLLSNSMSFGRPYILQIDGCIHDGWLVLRDENDLFDKRFLYYYLSAKPTYERFKTMAVGGVVNNLNSEMVRNLFVPVPSKVEQSKIADLLDISRNVILKRKQQLQKLDELVKARFVEMFGDYLKGDRKPLSEVATITGGLTKNSRRNTFETKMPYLRVANVFYNRLDLCEILKIGVKEEEIEKTLLQAGDLLFVEGNGSIEQIGRVAIWDGSIDPMLHQNHLIKARFNNEIITPEYALFYFMLQDGRQQIISKSVSTSGLNTLSVNKVSGLLLPIPPIVLQKQFGEFIKRVDKSKVVVQKALDEAQLLFDSLMQKYFG